MIGTEKQLFDAQTGKRVEVRDVLSIEVALDGWSVEGLALYLLPDEEVRKIIDNPNLAGL